MFRACDVALIVVVTTITWIHVAPESLPQASVAQVAPSVAGAVLLARVLRTSGAYRFDRRQGLWSHLAQVLSIAALVGLGAVVAALLLAPDDPAEGAAWQWTLLAAAGLVVLHAIWWLLVRAVARPGLADPQRGPRRRNGSSRGVDHRSHCPPRHQRAGWSSTIAWPALRCQSPESRCSGTLRPSSTTASHHTSTATHRSLRYAEPRTPSARPSPKRMQDVAIGLPMLGLSAPLLAVLAIAVKPDSPGPVFFRQRRHGFNNEEITVRKLRTMRHDGADARAERQVTADDDRITRVGRVLRKTSLDALPQLLNVIRGEMSLVGPRPHTVGMRTGDVESAQLVAEYAHRRRIKPGMAGWAAITGSRGPLHLPAEVKCRVALDVEYIERHSLWLDLKIMLLTLPSLLGDRSTVR